MENIIEKNIIGNYIEFYYYFKTIMSIIIPLIIFIGTLIICYRIRKCNEKLDEQNENIKTLIKIELRKEEQKNITNNMH